MRVLRTLCFASLVLAFGTGCSAISDFSDYVFQEEDEAPIPNDEGQAVGRGITTSADYRLSVSIGIPQPMGSASSEDYRVTVGPQASARPTDE